MLVFESDLSTGMAVPRVLVYGGKGALGSAVIKSFKENNWVGC